MYASNTRASFIYDENGRAYIDYELDGGSKVLGHLSLAEAGAPSVEQLQRQLLEVYPSMAAFQLTTGNRKALKEAQGLARIRTGRSLILNITADASMPADGTEEVSLTCPFNDAEKLHYLCSREKESLAAILLEPIPCRHGICYPEDAFIDAVAELQEQGLLIISDESASCLRTTPDLCSEFYDLEPDFLCLGTALANGARLAAYGCSQKLAFPPTVGPTAPSAAALAGAAEVLQHFSNPACLYQQESLCAILTGSLERAARTAGLPLSITRLGSMFSLVFKDAALYAPFRSGLLGQGIYFPAEAKRTCYLSLAHSTEDIRQTLDGATKVLSEIAPSIS